MSENELILLPASDHTCTDPYNKQRKM